MPEVFILCEYPTLNGGERSMLAVLGYVQASGFTPVVLAPPEGPLADELAARGVEIIPFRSHAIGQPPELIRQLLLSRGKYDCTKTVQTVRLSAYYGRHRLEQILSRRRPALLHANSLSMGRLSGPVVERLRLPSVAHLRDIIKLSARATADINRHTRILAVSNATREYHVAGGVDADKIHVLYNGVNLDEFCPRPPTGYLHRELGLPADAQLIGTIGQIGLRKGQDVLLRAAATIADRDNNIHYLIIGERNSEKEESRRFESDLHHVADSRLAGRVHFLGRRTDVSVLLNELTLLAHTARQEPLGRVLLEAAAAGVPVVATAVGGTEEIFPPHCNAARLVEADAQSVLAAALRELLDDESLRRRISTAARLRAETAFSSMSAAKNLMEHYSAVASI